MVISRSPVFNLISPVLGLPFRTKHLKSKGSFSIYSRFGSLKTGDQRVWDSLVAPSTKRGGQEVPRRSGTGRIENNEGWPGGVGKVWDSLVAPGTKRGGQEVLMG